MTRPIAAFRAAGLVLLLAAGCREPSPGRMGVLTLEDLLAAYGSSDTYDGLQASDFITPAGRTIPLLSPPFGAAPVLQKAGLDGINVLPAFSENAEAAYVVAEVWKDISEVWTQPWWLLVTGWNPLNPASLRVADSLPVVPAGPDSLFYSPFWQIVYAEAPADTPSDGYQSGGQILGDHLPIHEGGPILAPLAPPTFTVAAAGASPVRPYTGQTVGKERPVTALSSVYLNGEKLPFLSFGNTGYTWDDQRLIDEVPLFMFTRSDGITPAPEIPAVIGTGPLGSGKVAQVSPAGAPMFGGLTRLYTVRLPSTAGLFIAPAQDGLRGGLVGAAAGVKAPAVDASILALTAEKAPANFTLRIATDSDCFAATPTTPATAAAKRAAFPQSCGFLDSQADIEAFIPRLTITRHEILFTSPIVFFGGQKVGT